MEWALQGLVEGVGLVGARRDGCILDSREENGHWRDGSSTCERKPLCLMHGEAKQTGTSEPGAEKGLLQAHAGRWVAHALKSPKLPEGFCQSTFKNQVREEEKMDLGH